MFSSPLIQKLLPFLRWFPMGGPTIRADFIAGLTVALVLVPQSMAYAQLAGLPAYYGLYAAFLPVMIAAMWGSSNQLGTGPVAVASLLTLRRWHRWPRPVPSSSWCWRSCWR